MLPPALAKRIIAMAERRGWMDRVHVGMYVQTTSVTGYLKFWTLAKMRRCAASCIAIRKSRHSPKPGSVSLPKPRHSRPRWRSKSLNARA